MDQQPGVELMRCRNRFSGSSPGRGLARGFTLVETLVAAAVVSIAVVSVIAIVRKGQEQIWIDKHRRVARAIVDKTLEDVRFYPSNYNSIPASIGDDFPKIDTNINARRMIKITTGTLAGVTFKRVNVKVRWTEPATGVRDSVEIERLVPDIPDALRNIAPHATQITASSLFSAWLNVNGINTYFECQPWYVIDGIIGLRIMGDWASAGGDANPWIRLQWPETHRIKKIIVYDRTNPSYHTPGATAQFSDGSQITISNIPSCGSKEVVFGPKAITWVQFNLWGTDAYRGFAEIEIFE